ncbi:MAG: DUF21 domain-containing protein [Proteobacteria bacterium]|nr:DUF21 domain-containing protein [Pseudomonadota bacterium]
MITILIIDSILLFFTAFFNVVEISFLSTKKVHYSRYSAGLRKRIYRFYEKPSVLLSIVLIGVNITVIFISSITNRYILSNYNEITSTLLITSVILIFGEIIPKLWAIKAAKRIFPKFVIALSVFEKLFYPIIKFLDFISNLFYGFKIFKKKERITKEQMHDLISIIEQDGVISSNERNILQKMLNLENITVSDILIPRIHIVGVNYHASYKEIKELFRSSGLSRIIVYKNSVDHILGYIHIIDFITQERFDLKEITKDILFIPPTKHIDHLFYEMKDFGISIATVIDEFGETEGVITVEDILEEMFGEIEDEFSKDEEQIVKTDENVFRVRPSCETEDFNSFFHTKIPTSEDYETIGGFLMFKMEMIPPKGAFVQVNNVKITVESRNDRQIKSLRVEMIRAK